jgi:hypothetical protein
MKYAIDKIENNIVLLESLEDKTKKEVSLDILPKDIKEGTILTYNNNEYKIDLDTEKERKESIKNKFAMLKKKSG